MSSNMRSVPDPKTTGWAKKPYIFERW